MTARQSGNSASFIPPSEVPFQSDWPIPRALTALTNCNKSAWSRRAGQPALTEFRHFDVVTRGARRGRGRHDTDVNDASASAIFLCSPLLTHRRPPDVERHLRSHAFAEPRRYSLCEQVAMEAFRGAWMDRDRDSGNARGSPDRHGCRRRAALGAGVAAARPHPVSSGCWFAWNRTPRTAVSSWK